MNTQLIPETLVLPDLEQAFADINNTGLPVVRSESWIVDAIGQDAFHLLIEERVIIYAHDISTLDDVRGWVPCAGFKLNENYNQ